MNSSIKYKIGDIISSTDAFGTVKVLDIFTSTRGQHCYLVENKDDDCSFLCWEGELNTGQWKVSNE